ncbi:hypothetical protein [Fictibacillus sp. BK138]|uniref:hypothetical protein n=1 Tax=Fictibacillus sp. BK138 TaxID=2512121 RepID=UPI00102A25BE|nr:hypothetical protein [Fictibacillus sp. BK138]RZT15489.1 hypothetical protein EV282_3692 [Fictibacillus sp. BK138]
MKIKILLLPSILLFIFFTSQNAEENVKKTISISYEQIQENGIKDIYLEKEIKENAVLLESDIVFMVKKQPFHRSDISLTNKNLNVNKLMTLVANELIYLEAHEKGWLPDEKKLKSEIERLSKGLKADDRLDRRQLEQIVLNKMYLEDYLIKSKKVKKDQLDQAINEYYKDIIINSFDDVKISRNYL